jgi:hypothetical protein
MIDMALTGQVPASPSAGFPLYGLDMSWPGARWLDSFGEVIGEEVRWVRLAHQSLDTGAMILVETHSRPLTGARVSGSGQPPLQEVAFAASFVMVNLTVPADSAPTPDGLLRALVDHAHERSERYAEWLPVAWQVDGRPVTGRVWRFAGGWAAFSDAVPGVYLAVAGGRGTDPGGLAFTRVLDGAAYNFELDQPLHPRMLVTSSAARADGERPPLRRQEWDDDQLRLIHGQG